MAYTETQFHDTPDPTQLKAELAYHRDYLQRMVDERTADLMLAKAQLEQTNRQLQDEIGINKLLYNITMATNEAPTAEDALQACIEIMCYYTGWPVAHVYLCNPQTGVPELSDHWYYHTAEQFQLIKSVIEDKETPPIRRVPGKILRSTAPIWIPDVSDDPFFAGAERLAHTGIKACIAFPVITGGKVVAVLEFFDVKKVEPNEKLIGIMSYIGNQVGLAIERKQVLKELHEAKQKAEEASRAKSLFLANMSHEIRTPLNVIIGTAELMINLDQDPSHARYLESIHSSGEMLLALVSDILDISKIEAGELKLEFSPVNVFNLIEQVRQLFSRKSEEKTVRFSVEYAENAPREIHTDPLRFRQIIANLVDNALKFTKKGAITIRAFRVPEMDAVRFEVVDTGIGIPEEKQRDIFDLFTQADVSTTRQYGGSGLGLAICKQLVEAMGGFIGVKSMEGQGSTFWFTLPVHGVKEHATVSMES